MSFHCPNCGSDCWGTGLGADGSSVGCCHTSTLTGVGGCGFRWQRSRNNDQKLGIAPVVGTSGCDLYSDGSCSCAREAGVAGSCAPCAQKRAGAGAVITDCFGTGAPHGGGGHHGGGHGGHGGGVRHRIGGQWFGGWPRSWGPTTIIAPASCAWIPPTGRVPPSVIAALARQPFVGGWRTTFDSGWWAEQQSPNQYFVCVVADSVVTGLYGLGATADTSFPIWPIAIVGVVAVGIFVATLSIKKR